MQKPYILFSSWQITKLSEYLFRSQNGLLLVVRDARWNISNSRILFSSWQITKPWEYLYRSQNGLLLVVRDARWNISNSRVSFLKSLKLRFTSMVVLTLECMKQMQYTPRN